MACDFVCSNIFGLSLEFFKDLDQNLKFFTEYQPSGTRGTHSPPEMRSQKEVYPRSFDPQVNKI